MRSWVKVCGLTTADAVRAAVDAQVDAVGFVFAASKRRVDPQQAARLAADVPAKIARIAVMQHPSQALLDEVCAAFDPDILQTDYEDLAALRIPAELPVLPVLRSGQALPVLLPSRFLFEGAVSGTGETTDWSRAAQLAKQSRLVLAGGLNAVNVAAAVRAVRPYGVDVSSGVESAPGIKDPAKIAEFVRAARTAFDRFDSAQRTDGVAG
jgi:phosphoribosylanthranilate isomerase